MPLFSGNRRGFPSSLLPTTSTSTSRRKSSALTPTALRRRPAPHSFSFFSLGLLVSVLLFFAAVIRYGVPGSPSNPHTSTSPPASPRLIRRPLPTHTHTNTNINSAGGHVPSAPVDITTKDLYDRIQFQDLDGGAWKQGWPVQYNGDEWNQEKLKVFVVPHSHNDPGWKFTVEEYYERQSCHILDTIVDSLSKDARRKFIWEEMSYLERITYGN